MLARALVSVSPRCATSVIRYVSTIYFRSRSIVISPRDISDILITRFESTRNRASQTINYSARDIKIVEHHRLIYVI